VVAKAEPAQGEADPRVIATWLTGAECKARCLYEKVYCARGDMVGWDRGADRASNDADVSSTPLSFRTAGFPRYAGRLAFQTGPSQASFSLSLLPACADLRSGLRPCFVRLVTSAVAPL
jgi:hypothetical protein